MSYYKLFEISYLRIGDELVKLDERPLDWESSEIPDLFSTEEILDERALQLEKEYERKIEFAAVHCGDPNVEPLIWCPFKSGVFIFKYEWREIKCF